MTKNYYIIDSEDKFQSALQHLEASEIVAYDTETTGLNTRSDKVIGFSFSGSESVGYYLPLYVYDRVTDSLKDFNSDNISRSSELLRLLQAKKLVMHNASFDCRITKQSLGVDLLDALYCDTILLKHAVDEERPFGLKEIAKKIQNQLGLDVKKAANQEQVEMIESIKANGGSVTQGNYQLYKADTEKIGIYACADTDLTLRVFNYYSRLLKAERLEKFFYEDETMPLLKNVTIPMEEGGIPIDVKALEIAEKEIIEDIKILEDKIQAKIDPLLEEFRQWFLWSKFPPRRSGSFAQALAELVDLPLPKTSSGRVSLTKSSLEQLEPCPSRDYLLGGDYLQEDLVRQVQEKLFEESGERYMFNLASKHHLKKLFFEKLKEKPISKTDKGNPQVDHLFLQSIKSKYDWMPLLLDYNKLMKIKGAYIDRFLEQHEGGIFYPSFFQHRTISGRYGSDIQQLPRPIEDGAASDVVLKYNNQIRKFFIAGNGFKFIDADYESLEPHVFAHVSGDDGLKNIFLKGHDFYSTIAIDTESLEGVSADKKASNYLGLVNKSLRQKAKAYSLGIPYGLEAFKLSKELKIGQREAERLIKNYLKAYPKLAEWMERSNELCTQKGYIRSEAGRVRHMPSAPKIWYSEGEVILDSLKLWKKYHENPKAYKQKKYLRKQMRNYLNNAKNFQIQSLAASITNRACIAIAKELKRQNIQGYVCAQIHDQIVVRVPEHHAEKWKKIVEFLMCNTYKISLPLKAPAEIANDFYEGH